MLYGGDMKSQSSWAGGVKLHVDHDAVEYYIDASVLCPITEWKEILEYIVAHGFEIMDERECPPDPLEDENGVIRGYRFWLCHKDGEEFTA